MRGQSGCTGVGGACAGPWCGGPVGGVGACGEEEGGLCQPSSLGVAGRFPWPRWPVLGGRRIPGLVFSTRACVHPTLLVHHPEGGAQALLCGASHPAPSPWVGLGSTQGVVWCGVVWSGAVACRD